MDNIILPSRFNRKTSLPNKQFINNEINIVDELDENQYAIKKNLRRRMSVAGKKINYDYEKVVDYIMNNFMKKKAINSNLSLSKFTTLPYFLKELNVTESEYLKCVMYLMNKKNKSINEITFVSGYLYRLTNFTNFIAKAGGNAEDIINRISNQICYENVKKNSILFKFGDIGDKFYFILRGKMAVIIPSEKLIKMNEIDYIKYLAKLSKHHEMYILDKIIQVNRNVFPITNDSLESYLHKISRSSKTYYPKNSLTRELAISTLNYIKGYELNHKMTIDDYMNIFRPEIQSQNDEDVPYVTIYEHKIITYLETGEKFGEVALDKKDQKRVATIMAVEDSHLGVIDRNLYVISVKESLNKLKKINISFLMSNELFYKTCNSETFEKQYFNLFALRKYSRGMNIISADKFPNSIYFIKDGEYDVTMRKSINELNKIILNLGGTYKDRDEKNLIKSSEEFKKVYYQKHLIRLSIIVEKDIVGLPDMIFENSYFLEIKCSSITGEAFELEKKYFELINYKEQRLNTNYSKICNIKKNIMLEKLENFKKIKLSKFYVDYMSEVKQSKQLFKSMTNGITSQPSSISLINKDISKCKKENKNVPIIETVYENTKYHTITSSSFEHKNLSILEKKDSRLEWLDIFMAPSKTEETRFESNYKNSEKKNSLLNIRKNINSNNKRSVIKTIDTFKEDFISQSLHSSNTVTESNHKPNLLNFFDPFISNSDNYYTPPNKKNSIDEIKKLVSLKAKGFLRKEILKAKNCFPNNPYYNLRIGG